jgi:hypothetical protein
MSDQRPDQTAQKIREEHPVGGTGLKGGKESNGPTLGPAETAESRADETEAMSPEEIDRSIATLGEALRRERAKEGRNGLW